MMQRSFVILFLFCALSNAATAGSLAEFGVRGGTNMTFPRGLEDGVNSTSFVGWNMGVYGQLGLGDLIAVGADLYFASRAFKLEQDIAGMTQRSDIYAGTLNLPVVGRLGLPLNFMVELGAMYSYFLDKTDDTYPDGQGYIVAGIIWRPLSKWRIGARYLPSISSVSGDTYKDVGAHLTELYVGFVLF